MNIKIEPINSLNGEISAPPSKSYSHRVFITASLAKGISIIKKPLIFGDVGITLEVLKTLGVKVLETTKDTFIVEPSKNFLKPVDQILDCRNSGTSIRILSSLALLIEGGLSFKGEFLRLKRPILPLLEALKGLGAEYQVSKDTLFISRVKKKCKKIKIRGDISSQFITSLLITCPLLACEKKGYITIEVLTPITSYPYIDITKYVLESFGINIIEDLYPDKTATYYINNQQNFRTQSFEIPGDFSSVANIIVATILSPDDSKVIITNLDFNKPQGDKRILEILQNMGANIEIDYTHNQVIVYGNRNKNVLKGLDIDIYENPDLFPILAIVGIFAQNKTTLYNALNLRLKESNRIAIIARELIKMGVKLKQEEDKLTIYQCNNLKGSILNHENDHRIAMALVIAALYANSISKISNIKIVQDSYPNFISELNKLGAKIEVKD